jgi:ribonuclease D
MCLDVLFKIANDDDIDKTLHDSPWGDKFLADAQNYYAETDSVVGLKVYNTLSKMPDLSVRLDKLTAADGLLVDMLPNTGDRMCLASKVREGIALSTTKNCITSSGVLPAIVTNSRT